MYKLTKREKVLIYLMLLFAIVAGGVYFILKPSADKLLLMEAELDSLQTTCADYKASISLIPSLEQSIVDSKKSVRKNASYLYDLMLNEELDVMLQDWMEQQGLLCREIVMRDVVYDSLPNYYTPEGEASGVYLYYNTADISGYGSTDDIRAFCDMLSSLPSARLRELHMDIGEEGAEFSVTLIAYMCEDIPTN